MSAADSGEKGRLGERLAEKTLRKAGCRILERNYRAGRHEIDLIAQQRRDGTLLFVEVKARTDGSYGLPCEAVGVQKQRFLRLAAESYLAAFRGEYSAARFDVIEVYLPMGRVEWIENAF